VGLPVGQVIELSLSNFTFFIPSSRSSSVHFQETPLEGIESDST
jgi:hypothetical protein